MRLSCIYPIHTKHKLYGQVFQTAFGLLIEHVHRYTYTTRNIIHTVSHPACLRHTALDAFQSTSLEKWEKRLPLIPNKARFSFQSSVPSRKRGMNSNAYSEWYVMSLKSKSNNLRPTLKFRLSFVFGYPIKQIKLRVAIKAQQTH